ncbi:MAG: NUDIX domain-containing protein [Chlamydiota bacterium]|jgi:8-oxo-dGTP pyrophosphatase MutT (NUDIX family)
MEKHFTATAYVLYENKFLLHLHQKIGKWLPPGGHIEANETPIEAVKREVLEETGLNIEIISQENLWIDNDNAASFERPFLCLLENINGSNPHQHMDLIYLARPLGNPFMHSEAFQWLTLHEVQQKSDIYSDTVKTIEAIDKLRVNETLSASS